MLEQLSLCPTCSKTHCWSSHKAAQINLTGNVEALGGGAFLLNIASVIDSKGSVSSFCITNSGLSHLLLGLGGSKRITKALNLKLKLNMKLFFVLFSR